MLKCVWPVLLLGAVACQQVDKRPHLPVDENIYVSAIKPVDFYLQRFSIDQEGQAYGVRGRKLFRIDTLNDQIEQIYEFDAAIVGFHIATNNAFVVSTDNNHWDPKSPCHIYESIDKGRSFLRIKTIMGGCSLWLSITSDREHNLYAGEYGPKQPGMSKNVWKRDSNTGRWSIVFQLDLDSTAHIHRVSVDPKTQYLWVSAGDTRRNRGIYLSTDQGLSWQLKLDSQATSVAFDAGKIYWGEDKKGYGGIFATNDRGENPTEVFNAGNRGNYTGSIYELLRLPDSSVLAPIMKYANRDNVASLWHGKDHTWRLLLEFKSLPGHSVDTSSIAGPDKNGYVLLTGYKLKLSELPAIH